MVTSGLLACSIVALRKGAAAGRGAIKPPEDGEYNDDDENEDDEVGQAVAFGLLEEDARICIGRALFPAWEDADAEGVAAVAAAAAGYPRPVGAFAVDERL